MAFFVSLQVSGQEYFQQEVNYKISAVLDDEGHSVSAFENVQYINKSSATLTFIYFHLWPNAYRDRETALAKQLLLHGKTDFFFAPEKDRGFIDSLDFRVNNERVTMEYDPEHADVCKLILNEPLRPGDVVEITTPFHVKIPDARFSRLGHTGQAYYITQWYPKPAVFDNRGWHPMPYLDQGEFYSEFGSFDVSITLPSNYVLAASGERVRDAGEELFISERVRQTSDHLNNSGLREGDMEFGVSSAERKTVHYRIENAHDFAWFADKRFYEQHDSVILPGSGKVVQVRIYFTGKNFGLWQNAMQSAKDALFFYSGLVGDYPYSELKIVDGTIMAGSGMEYPGITVIGDCDSELDLDVVISHETGHNWFYAALGSNERDEPVMDEGINSFYEQRYTREKYPFEKITWMIGKDSTFRFLGLNKTPYWKMNELAYFTAARAHTDQSLLLGAEQYTERNYGSMIYSKSVLAFDYLLDKMGAPAFDSLMHAYFKKYRFRHVSYKDFSALLSEYNGDLAASFHSALINTDRDIDLSVKKIKKNPDQTFTLVLKNRTGAQLPFSVSGLKGQRVVKTAWYQPIRKKEQLLFPAAEIDRIVIDAQEKIPDVNRKNNSSRTEGSFRKMKPLSFRLVTALEDPAYNQVNYIPTVGGNYYNGLMAGVTLHNYGLYEKRTEMSVTPLYAFRSRGMAGSAYIDRKFYPRRLFSKITTGIKVKHYAYDEYRSRAYPSGMLPEYSKIAPFVELELKPKKVTGKIRQTINYGSAILFTDSVSFSEIKTKGPFLKHTRSFVNSLNYELSDSRVIDPFTLLIQMQHTQSMGKVSLTWRQKFTLTKSANIDLRFFGGVFVAGRFDERGYYAFRSSGYSGYQDYAFDYYYMARNMDNGMGGAQFTETDGNMKVRTPLGQTSRWLLALNVKTPRAFRLPVRLFGDVSVCDPESLLADKFLWDAGVNLTLWKEIIEIYLPVFYSDDIRKVMQLNDVSFPETIRFTLNIHKLGPKYVLQNSLF